MSAALLLAPGCSSNTSNSAGGGSSPTATSSAQKVKFAKTRFLANAGLAAGATYQWIYKPLKAGTFKKGAKGRTGAFVKAGLAGGFTYNRLKHAIDDAKGDPALSKLVSPLSGGVDSLKSLGSKAAHGQASEQDLGQFSSVVDKVKGAASKDGLNVTNQIPSASQLVKG
ncbi:hypothetical protein [Phaeacidiphilus oryzae]|jgi:hypothetical protein|uniref:hypothetical protein n=1 Tax=Phaeacidiphilus oryzae TaxID=348818 RepID=UPI00068DAAE2|nr:hypothetical protein [Phaeacidiphilus oryzae]